MVKHAFISGAAAVAVAVGASMVAAVPAGAAASSESAAARAKVVQYFAEQPLSTAKATPAANLPAVARAQLAGKTATPDIATPRGYKLRRGGLVNNYVYKSAYVYAIEVSCNSDGCRPVQQVKLQLKETAFGRTSKRWKLELFASHYSGPQHFGLRYYYECGVNIAHAEDKTCSSWKHDHADGSASGAAHNGTVLNHSFGTTNNVTKFPMVRFDVKFADGSSAVGDDGHTGEKFRGWDVCVKARSTKMCAKTGTGD